jgi:hypothetical protein
LDLDNIQPQEYERDYCAEITGPLKREAVTKAAA